MCRPKHWVVILGCPRSGTTYLLEALRAIDGLEGTETACPSQFGPIWANAPQPGLRAALSFSFERTLDAWLEQAETSRGRALASFFRRDMGPAEFMARVLRRRHVKAALYKEPFLAFAPELPYAALPGCRIIHIFRDGRDVADSLERRYAPLGDHGLEHPAQNELLFTRAWDHRHIPWWVDEHRDEEFIASSSFVRSVWMWKEMVRRAHAFASRTDVSETGRVIEVRYESLVCDPVVEGQRLLDRLGVAGGRRVWRRFREAHDRSVGIHTRRPVDEIAAATKLASAELEMLGYEVSPS